MHVLTLNSSGRRAELGRTRRRAEETNSCLGINDTLQRYCRLSSGPICGWLEHKLSRKQTGNDVGRRMEGRRVWRRTEGGEWRGQLYLDWPWPMWWSGSSMSECEWMNECFGLQLIANNCSCLGFASHQEWLSMHMNGALSATRICCISQSLNKLVSK